MKYAVVICALLSAVTFLNIGYADEVRVGDTIESVKAKYGDPSIQFPKAGNLVLWYDHAEILINNGAVIEITSKSDAGQEYAEFELKPTPPTKLHRDDPHSNHLEAEAVTASDPVVVGDSYQDVIRKMGHPSVDAVQEDVRYLAYETAEIALKKGVVANCHYATAEELRKRKMRIEQADEESRRLRQIYGVAITNELARIQRIKRIEMQKNIQKLAEAQRRLARLRALQRARQSVRVSEAPSFYNFSNPRVEPIAFRGSSSSFGGTTFHNFGGQSGSSIKIGDTTFHNFEGKSGTSIGIGNTTFHNFGGQSGSSIKIGDTTFHNFGEKSGTSIGIGNTTFHNFGGQSGSSIKIGDTTFHNFGGESGPPILFDD